MELKARSVYMKFSLAFKKNNALVVKGDYQTHWQNVQTTLLKLISRLSNTCFDYLNHQPVSYALNKMATGYYQLQSDNRIFSHTKLKAHHTMVLETYRQLKRLAKELAHARQLYPGEIDQCIQDILGMLKSYDPINQQDCDIIVEGKPANSLYILFYGPRGLWPHYDVYQQILLNQLNKIQETFDRLQSQS